MLIGHFDVQCNWPDNWELWPDLLALKVILTGSISVTEAKSKKRLFLEKEKNILYYPKAIPNSYC